MKIVAISSIRSDYDLLSGLYKKLDKDNDIDLRLVISGAHLSEKYGYSYANILKDGLKELARIETLIDSNSKVGRLKTASILLQGSVDIVQAFKPDLLLYPGDREDVLVGAMLGAYLGIPSIHFFGGDHATDGYVDNPVRHATSKLSTVHMVTLEEHKRRLMAIGEEAERIFYIGNPALDKFITLPEISRSELERNPEINCKIPNRFAIVIYHPSVEAHEDLKNIQNILNVLKDKGIKCFINYPNSDAGSQNLIQAIEEIVNTSENFVITRNLSREVFISLYKKASFIIGNSSSGIIEAASIPIPAINVGERQRNRFAGINVIFCNGDYNSIELAVQKSISRKFLNTIREIKNPYGDGCSIEKAYHLIKTLNFQSFLLKKKDPLINE